MGRHVDQHGDQQVPALSDALHKPDHRRHTSATGYVPTHVLAATTFRRNARNKTVLSEIAGPVSSWMSREQLVMLVVGGAPVVVIRTGAALARITPRRPAAAAESHRPANNDDRRSAISEPGRGKPDAPTMFAASQEAADAFGFTTDGIGCGYDVAVFGDGGSKCHEFGNLTV